MDANVAAAAEMRVKTVGILVDEEPVAIVALRPALGMVQVWGEPTDFSPRERHLLSMGFSLLNSLEELPRTYGPHWSARMLPSGRCQLYFEGEPFMSAPPDGEGRWLELARQAQSVLCVYQRESGPEVHGVQIVDALGEDGATMVVRMPLTL